jgi:hypothetical protein
MKKILTIIRHSFTLASLVFVVLIATLANTYSEKHTHFGKLLEHESLLNSSSFFALNHIAEY